MTGWPNQPTEAAVEAGPPEDEAAFLARRNHEIQNWLNAKETASNAVEEERTWRGKVTATLFPTTKKGTQRYQLSGGYAVKLVQTYTYPLGDKDAVDDNGMKFPIRKQVEAILEAISDLGPEGALLADRLVKWEPAFDNKEYEALDGDNPIHVAAKKLIDTILTIKPGSPQLAFEEPKPA